MGQIRRLSKANYQDIFSLSQFAFQYYLNPDQFAKKEKEAERHEIWGYIVDEQLAGKLHHIPLRVLINGTSLKMGGVSSVATWPEYRRQGIAKKLLLHSLQEMKKAGETISYLHPFHVGFYRKYGWELAFSNKNYTIPIERLKRKWDGNGYIRRNRNLELLQEIYTKYASKFNGMLERDKKWWEQRVLTDEEAQVAIAYNNVDAAEGYIIYKVKDDIFTAKEVAYTSINGQHVLYEFIANHDSMAEKVKLTVPENDLLPYMIDDPTFDQEVEPYFMARIVDVLAFLKQYIFPVDGVIQLQVEDEFLLDNNGVYVIRSDNGETFVTKMEGKGDGNIKCSIQQLVAICLGYKRPTELFEYGLLEGDRASIELLEKMIPKTQTFLTDFF
ncbi:GNAT family N-acetyltransferase [Pseudogracilibacillus auburnensis]|uniref:GNAT family N-acetyltransferase n=1 Tax=Pseudogracilibacillus auburnensis TaxID=1494959 RepID=UPI001A974E2B|nr:GNAT family N-acetyltransferase [Pseudogracilibacillus auburnensis]MBO1004639.1 GNAT family N-acetyltransferase [Pseudogracilibacillus auburnensis]